VRSPGDALVGAVLHNNLQRNIGDGWFYEIRLRVL
jgi:hypothetical protein